MSRLRTVLQRDAVADFFEDFFVWRSGDWTDTNDGGTGTVAVANARGGWLQLPTAAAQHDYHLLGTPAKLIELVAARPVQVEARIKITEAAANSSSWVFGISDTLTTGFMANDGEPPASWDGSVIYKPTGATAIKHKTSNASAATVTANIGTFATGTEIVVGLVFDPGDGTTGSFQPYVNGMGTKPNFDKLPAHRVTLASLGPCYLIFGVKAGTAAAETLQIDYVGAQLTR